MVFGCSYRRGTSRDKDSATSGSRINLTIYSRLPKDGSSANAVEEVSIKAMPCACRGYEVLVNHIKNARNVHSIIAYLRPYAAPLGGVVIYLGGYGGLQGCPECM